MIKLPTILTNTSFLLALTLGLTACGGGSSSNQTTTPPPPSTYTIGGNVTGLASGQSVTLQDNGGDNLVVTANGPFTFSTALATGARYDVTISLQPSGQTCTVNNGSGTVASSNVKNVVMSCVSTAAVGATTGSTAFSVFSTGNSRIAFLPVGTGVMPFSVGSVDSTSTTSTAVRAASTTTPSVKLSLIPISFTNGSGPDACSVDSAAQKMVCIQLQSTQVAILDLSKFASTGDSADVTQGLVTLSDLPDTSTVFSGDDCVDCGVVSMPNVSKPSAGQFIVAGYDGYHVYNYPAAGEATATAASVYNVPISENLSVDTTRNWVIAPGYDYVGTGAGRMLNIIDLNKGKVFSWSEPTDSCTGETDSTQQSLCSNFAYEEIDSSAMDPSTGVLTLQSESGNELLQVDMGQAVFNGATFTAPHRFFAEPNTVTGSVEMSGALASGSENYLFTASEFSGDAWIGSAALPGASGTGGNFPSGYAYNPVYADLSAALASSTSPACSSFTGGYDPHRQATMLSLGGKQYGLYASDDGMCVAVVNLGALLAAPHTVNPNLVDSSYDLVSHEVVQFIPAP